MKNIKVYEIEYLYLTDDDYFNEVNRDNELTDEEIQEQIGNLEGNKEIIFKFDDYSFDEDEWNDPEFMEEALVNMLEEETCEYLEDFSWTYLSDSE